MSNNSFNDVTLERYGSKKEAVNEALKIDRNSVVFGTCLKLENNIMELLNVEKDALSIKLSKKDLVDMLSTFTAVQQNYNGLDEYIIQIKPQRVTEMLNMLRGILTDMNTANQNKSTAIHVGIS